MSVITRAVTAFAVLSLAAIPVAALTIKNTSDKEVTVGVHNGVDQAVYAVPPGGSVDVREDCSSDCAVTGPWGFSRMVPQNVTIETDGQSLVAGGVSPPAPSLVPQNPVAEPSDPTPEPVAAEMPEPAAAEPAVTEAPAAEATPAETEPAAKPARKHTAKPRKHKQQAAKKKGPPSGSFQMLFMGPGK